MTAIEFDQAVADDRPVRLKNRGRTFHDNEWYEPFHGDEDGRRRIHAETGEVLEVDGELLEALTTQVPPTTAGELAERVESRERPDTPVFVYDSASGKLRGLEREDIARVELIENSDGLRELDGTTERPKPESRVFDAIIIGGARG